MEEERQGFTCECGKFHVFGVYVMAHWDEKLIHTCPECDRVHQVCRGRATLQRSPKKRKAVVVE